MKSRASAGPLLGHIVWFIESRLSPWMHRRHQYVTVSLPSARDLTALGVGQDRIAVVRNGLDEVPPSSLQVRRSQTPRVAVLSRLVPHKQIEDALDAVAALRPRIPDLHLDVVGRQRRSLPLIHVWDFPSLISLFRRSLPKAACYHLSLPRYHLPPPSHSTASSSPHPLAWRRLPVSAMSSTSNAPQGTFLPGTKVQVGHSKQIAFNIKDKYSLPPPGRQPQSLHREIPLRRRLRPRLRRPHPPRKQQT